MALMDHVTPRITVPLLGDNTMSVRGLNLDDFAALLTEHLEPISKAVALYAQHKQSVFSNSNLHGFVLEVAKDFPALVSEVISIAADEPEAKGKKLGVGFQLAAISAIMKLTMEEAGGLGNLFASLAALVQGALQNASELTRNPSRGSIGA